MSSKSSPKTRFKFEEFFQAFGRSVTIPDNLLGNNGSQAHAISQPTLPQLRKNGSRDKTEQQVVNGALDIKLPEHLSALLALQESDGSWRYSKEFQYVIQQLAPPPPEGISGKSWATAIAITVCRQSPEFFAQLSTQYAKAMLHAADDVLKLVKSQLDFSNLQQVRPYCNAEAKAVAEQLAREAAARRAQEDDEDRQKAAAREHEQHVMKLSLVRARHLPMPTQTLFLAGLHTELEEVFPRSSLNQTESSMFKTGDIVESCWRRRDHTSHAEKQSEWYPCQITSVNKELNCSHIIFLDQDRERERNVGAQYIRRRPDDARAIRDQGFAALQQRWTLAVPCAEEVSRLEELQESKMRAIPWNSRPLVEFYKRESISESKDLSIPKKNARKRDLVLVANPLLNSSLDQLYQTAVLAVLEYDKAYRRVCDLAKSGCTKYATAVLYRDRFHAFDAFGNAVVALTERTVQATDKISEWKDSSCEDVPVQSRIFVWNGQNFAVRLARSLDFLGCARELVDWYGEEFPWDMNPFLRSTSLLDKAEDLGLRIGPHALPVGNALRTALKLHKCDTSIPTWWPETRYDQTLVDSIERAEQFILHEMQAAGLLLPPAR